MDMHLHTHRSFDCLSRPHQILETARRRGIDRLVITDHNEIRGALELHDLDPNRIIIGEEIKTAEGFDLIGIFISELIPAGTPAIEAAAVIRDQGGIVYLPHPFDAARAGATRFLDRIAHTVDVVEVHNSRCWLPSFDQRALDWARRHDKLIGAGSDAHTPREIGRGLVELPNFEPDRASFLAALADATITTAVRSSPLVRLSSTYAKLYKRVV
jgi:predicted metal-dependent phosphoesterase TrpH